MTDILRIFMAVAFMLAAAAPYCTADEPQGPGLEYVCELKVSCDAPYAVGPTAHGERVVIPIVAGTFEGPAMRGTVIAGGADYQLVDKSRGRVEYEAIYSIRTDDGVNIHVRNTGVSVDSTDADGRHTYYFRTTPRFEAPQGSAYEWLNDAVFVCVPSFADGQVCLKVWKVL